MGIDDLANLTAEIDAIEKRMAPLAEEVKIAVMLAIDNYVRDHGWDDRQYFYDACRDGMTWALNKRMHPRLPSPASE